ncbi:MAG TPA: VCBS repeat-containing protein [Polyangiaceae bacterium]|nr:VCBS repeat-containing protein [Polyangiaceae bacterium]
MRSRWGLWAPLLLSLASCRDFPTIEANTCGNAVLEPPTEDCDTFIDLQGNDGGICRPKGVVGECHWDCTVDDDNKRGTCPDGWGCGTDGLCHQAGSDYEATPLSSDLSSWLTTADFDGDGRADLISNEPENQLRQARFRLHYFDDASKLVETRLFPRVTTRPVAYQPAGKHAAADLIFSNFRIGMLPGRRDREWVPAAFSSYVVPNTDLRVVSLLDELVDGATVLATFSDLGEGRGVYVPRPDGSRLDFKAPLLQPIDQLVADPLAVDLFPGNDSPCKDVVYAYRGDSAAHVLDLCRLGSEGEPDITFRAEPREQLVRLPEGLLIDAPPVVADLEGDGDLDLLLGSGGLAYVAYGDGTTLADATGPLELRLLDKREPLPLAMPLAAGDLSGDDVADFVMPSGVLSSHRSLVDGSVAYGASYANNEQPWTLAEVIDLNGNELPDVVAAAQGSPGITLLNGTGGFYQVAAHLSTRGDVRLLTTGDFDGDLLRDIAFLEGAPRPELPDGLAIAFGTRDQLPASSKRIAELRGSRQLGRTRDVSLDSLFVAASGNVGGVQQGSLTLWDGSPDRLPFAPYTLVPFAQDMRLTASQALSVVVGGFTRPGASDVVALGVEHFDVGGVTLWLVPDITGVVQPPRQLDFVPAEGVEPTLTTSTGALQLRLATLAADLDGDGLDEVVGLMPTKDADCALVSYDIDVEHHKADMRGDPRYLGVPCPQPELGSWDEDADGHVDSLVLLTGDIGHRRLSLLSHVAHGFETSLHTFVDVGDEDVRGFAVFPERDGKRLAFVTDVGLAFATSSGMDESLDRVRRVMDFTDARSVAVIDVNLDNLDDLVVADAQGLWLVQAELK